MAEKFIQRAVVHEGAARRQAAAEGLPVAAWARKHRHDEGRTGRQARLAITLARLRRRRKHG